jgi:hypothetical protein
MRNEFVTAEGTTDYSTEKRGFLLISGEYFPRMEIAQ